MRKKLLIGLAVIIFSMAIATSGAFARRGGGGGGGTTTINIDTIYTVDSYGSTTLQDTFNWGEVPWLYFELPSGAGTTSITTQSWWYDSDGVQLWYVSENNADNTVQIWHSLTTGDWDTIKSEGVWDVNVTYNALNGDTTGTGYTKFTVTAAAPPTVVPEPISSILFLAGSATLGFRSYRKRRKNA